MKRTKTFLAEFKEFAYRGNVVDMAVGVIIGAAFKAIVDSLVNDVVMPFIGVFVDTGSFKDIVLHLGSVNIMIGNFISAVINFIIIAFVIFCMVKMINKAHQRLERKAEIAKEEEVKKPTTEELLTDILNELRNK